MAMGIFLLLAMGRSEGQHRPSQVVLFWAVLAMLVLMFLMPHS